MNAVKYILLFMLMLALGLGVLPARAHNPAGGHTTTTTVTCTPNPIAINAPATCTATVTDVIGNGQDAVPSGTVTFSSSGAGSFNATTCTLAPAGGFSASCSVTYTSTATGNQTITASYPLTTDAFHRFSASSGITTLTVLVRPAVAKSFTPTTIATSASSTLTITLTNSNTTTITGAAFTDTYPASLVNAATPAGSTTCASGTVTAAAAGGSVALSGATIPASGSCTVTVSVTSGTAGSYTNTLAIGAVTSTNAGSNSAAASATLTVNASVTSFDAVEVGASPNTNLYSKRGGVNFSVDVLALDSSNLVSTGYTGTVSLVLVDASSGGGVCAAMTSLQALGSLTFIAANAGRKTTLSINYAGAARNAKIRIADAGLGITSCSFDAFAIRPTNFSVTSNMTNTGSSGAPFLNAGGSFTLTATGLFGYNGTPTIDSSKIAAHAGATQIGSIAGVFAAAVPATGGASGSTFTYSEVGNFQFLTQGVFDDAFTAVDQPNDCTNDFSNALAGGKYGCKFGTTAATSLFGRFTPFDFAVTRNTPTFGTACSANFTYVGQPFNYSSAPALTVTARNSSGITTRNYVGAFMKITNASITPNSTALRYTRFDALGGGNTPALDVTSLPSAAVDPAIGTFINGVGILTFSGGAVGAVFTRTLQVVPFDADIALSFSLADADGIVTASIDGAAGVNPVSFGIATAGNGMGFAGGPTFKRMRFGRLSLRNAFGSELLDLPIPMETQYYNSGGVYITNADDSCTTIALNNVFRSSGAAAIGGAFASGKGNLKITKPLSKVSIDLCVDLDGATPTDPLCVASGANKAWLQWKWSGSAYDQDPKARATFGVYKNADEFIYLRENF